MYNSKDSLLQNALDALSRGFLLDGEKVTYESKDGKVVMYNDGESLTVKVKRNNQ
ncbi:hypothetical protein [Bacillus phage vB_BanS-Thrax3]|nr:hypothetical protein [Bacillus phage vB_BanS-Thrax3]